MPAAPQQPDSSAPSQDHPSTTVDLKAIALAAWRAVHAADCDLDTVRDGYWAVPWSEFQDLDEALEPWRKACRSEQAL